MTGILVLGAGGHAKVVADIFLRRGEPVAGFLDDNPLMWGTMCLGLPILGPIQDFHKHKPHGLVIGIGVNKVRKHISEIIGDAGQELWVNAIHPQAIVAESANLGHGIVICAGAVVNPEVSLGNHVIINTSASVDHDCRIGDYIHIAPGTHLAGDVHVDEGTLIGVGVSVIPNRKIGCWSVVGAGATVVQNIPDHVTAKGTPARWS